MCLSVLFSGRNVHYSFKFISLLYLFLFSFGLVSSANHNHNIYDVLSLCEITENERERKEDRIASMLIVSQLFGSFIEDSTAYYGCNSVES